MVTEFIIQSCAGPRKKFTVSYLLGYHFFALAGSRGDRGRMKIAHKIYLSCVSLILLNVMLIAPGPTPKKHKSSSLNIDLVTCVSYKI